MVLASDLRKRLQAAAPVLQAVTPRAGNARLTDRERTEIQGYYMTGNYTQEQLASQFQVSQATVSNIVSDDDDSEA
nr:MULTISPECIES: sigma factor-like helix-turn-helix DNA-binding protein [Pseudomonas]